MNKTRVLQILAGCIFISVGVLLFPLHADQEFINLTPSEGAGMLISLKSENAYEQTFITRTQSISKIGAYFMPVHASAKTSNGKIRIELLQDGSVKAQTEIPVFQIDNDGASLVQISPPLATIRGELVTMKIAVTPNASGLIALRKRVPDETFLGDDVTLSINGLKETHPVAYRVFESIWPPLTRQIAGLFAIAGLALLFWNFAKQHIHKVTCLILVGLAALYAIPAYAVYPLYMPGVALFLILMFLLFRVTGRSNLASVFGACIFVFSTWLPLYVITGGDIAGTLTLRDALLDPNQVSVSHSAGGYVGIVASLFAISGLLIYLRAMIKKRFVLVQADTFVMMLFVLSICTTFFQWPFYSPRGIILVVFCFAWFASLALDKLQRFLGVRDTFIQTLMVVLLSISILDLMHVAARTFSYGLGI